MGKRCDFELAVHTSPLPPHQLIKHSFAQEECYFVNVSLANLLLIVFFKFHYHQFSILKIWLGSSLSYRLQFVSCI